MKTWKNVLVSIFTIGTVIGSSSAIAADSITLKYRIFRSSISVEELKTFSESGELSSSLDFYVRRSQQDPEHLRKALNSPVPANGVVAYRFLNSTPGEMILDQMTTVIKNPSGKANRESLRAAIVSSALEDNQIRLIEVIDHYPTSEVIVEGDKLIELHQNLNRVINRFACQPWLDFSS